MKATLSQPMDIEAGGELIQQDQGKQAQGQEEEPNSNDERWSLIWVALIIYWAIDAVTIFLIAFVSLIVSVIFKASTASDEDDGQCEVANTMFILSLMIFLTRLIDMVLGFCTVGCWFCRNNTDNDDRGLIPHIRNCIIISIGQGLLSLANIVLGVIGLMSEGSACAGSIISIVFAVLLIMDSGFEMFVWIGAYFVRINQHNAPIPPIVDKIIPDCLMSFARRIKL